MSGAAGATDETGGGVGVSIGFQPSLVKTNLLSGDLEPMPPVGVNCGVSATGGGGVGVGTGAGVGVGGGLIGAGTMGARGAAGGATGTGGLASSITVSAIVFLASISYAKGSRESLIPNLVSIAVIARSAFAKSFVAANSL